MVRRRGEAKVALFSSISEAAQSKFNAAAEQFVEQVRGPCRKEQATGPKKSIVIHPQTYIRNGTNLPLYLLHALSFGKFISHIDISNQPLSDSSLKTLLSSTQSLTSLSLRRCGALTGKGFAISGGSDDLTLRHLSLNDCKLLTDRGVYLACKLFGAALVTISVSCCKLLTDKSVRSIAKCCARLESCDLNSIPCRESSVRKLLTNCSQTLRAINIGGCEGLSDEFAEGEMSNWEHNCLIYRIK